jgi:hypothetical protein
MEQATVSVAHGQAGLLLERSSSQPASSSATQAPQSKPKLELLSSTQLSTSKQAQLRWLALRFFQFTVHAQQTSMPGRPACSHNFSCMHDSRRGFTSIQEASAISCFHSSHVEHPRVLQVLIKAAEQLSKDEPAVTCSEGQHGTQMQQMPPVFAPKKKLCSP